MKDSIRQIEGINIIKPGAKFALYFMKLYNSIGELELIELKTPMICDIKFSFARYEQEANIVITDRGTREYILNIQKIYNLDEIEVISYASRQSGEFKLSELMVEFDEDSKNNPPIQMFVVREDFNKFKFSSYTPENMDNPDIDVDIAIEEYF